jgi:hypothetical protein
MKMLAYGLLALVALCPGRSAEPDRIRFTFTRTTLGPTRDTPAFVTVIGRDDSGRFCHLNRDGGFAPCAPEDQTVLMKGRTWAVYGLPLQDPLTVEVDRALRVDSGRIYLSVGGPTYLRVDAATGALVEPDPANPDDPNGPLIYDWVEFALDAAGFHGNTTCVDQFGMPVTLAVTDRRHPADVLGPVGITQARAELFTQWKASVPEAFQALEDPAECRILAPSHATGTAAQACKDYFKRYVADFWAQYRTQSLTLTPVEGTFTGHVEDDDRLVFTRAGDSARYRIDGPPTTTEVFRCSGVLARGNGLEKVLGAQLAALLNRHLADPLRWRDAGDYYQASPCNHYARFWHQHSLAGLAYGFPYDDVNDQSPSLATGEPLEIRITCRWD